MERRYAGPSHDLLWFRGQVDEKLRRTANVPSGKPQVYTLEAKEEGCDQLCQKHC